MTVRLVMATVDRAPKTNYVIESLESLYGRDRSAPPVTLFVGSPNVAYLDPVAQDGRVTIVPTSEREWDDICNLGGHAKAKWNLHRAIASSYAIGGDGVVLLEDDVQFSEYWYSRLVTVGRRLWSTHGDVAMLSAYSVYEHMYEWAPECGYGEYPGHFYASLCVLLSNEGRQRAVERIPSVEAAFDISLGKIGLTAWGTLPSLVQHVGDESALGPHEARRALNFFG